MNSKLLSKLGWKPGRTMLAMGRPETLMHFEPFPSAPETGPVDLLLGFAARSVDVAVLLDALLPRYARSNRLWLAYPKRSGAIRSDLSRDAGWEALVPHDLLPVTQVALDATWSALRFRYRDEIRTLTRKGA
ncbi:hypothetical protein Rumeso_01243 [Rubellimicrobium mesophilum DSM 19309]|uniref:DUF3052 domain-containing protein n=1 Tax=Rubellimicrobium mesophilum DSM 19309 TaxID=442562 RepID=A0A017HRX9_9RHOB|nr:hypothetical protein [Rubellimicrobium mesophilum]EYD77131.1 hypothetical protein Rumeso_01243 [Rubellimicrobium mesophilum DSM 19309]